MFTGTRATLTRRFESRHTFLMLPIILVSGFLGAGKTTLMRRLIFDAKARGLRVAVVVNEWGDVDVDGHILREADADLLASIAGGCACCSGTDELQDTLLELATRDAATAPDWVLLEASGLADPALLLDALTSPQLVSRVQVSRIVCVADATRAEVSSQNTSLAPLLRRQLALADDILLNKADRVARATLDAFAAQVRALNPRAQVSPCIECEVSLHAFWTRELAPREVERGLEAAHPVAHSVLVPVPHPIERADLEAAMRALSPEVWRAKGFVRLRGVTGLQLLQYTGGVAGGEPGDWHFAPFRVGFGIDEPSPVIVFLGAHLNAAQLRRDFGGAKLLPIF